MLLNVLPHGMVEFNLVMLIKMEKDINIKDIKIMNIIGQSMVYQVIGLIIMKKIVKI